MSYSVSASMSMSGSMSVANQKERVKQERLKYARRKARQMAARHTAGFLVAWRGAAAQSHLEFTYEALQQYRMRKQASGLRYWMAYYRFRTQRRQYTSSPSLSSIYSGIYSAMPRV